MKEDSSESERPLTKSFSTDPQLAKIESEWMGSIRKALVVGLAVVWCLWQLWFAVTIPPAPVLFRSLHLAFGFAIAFLMYPGFRRIRPAWLRGVLDVALALVAVWPLAHLIANFVRPDVVRLIMPEQIDVVAGLTIFAMIILVNWRVGGPPLALTAAVFLAYMFYGSSLPTPWGHSGTYMTPQIISGLYLKLDTGILGVATSAAANLIFPVLFFGSTLIAYGAGDFLSNLTTAALGRLRGAPAKIAVVASAGFASITGTGPA
ncbi:MAG: TRAP transporter large permease subunit, partial [Acidimicrobiia bacterium]|nr:TRAP transporter large permease subunit [Acidimicrobiia bacterium]